MVWQPRQVSDPDGGRSAAAGVRGGDKSHRTRAEQRGTLDGPAGGRDRDPDGNHPGPRFAGPRQGLAGGGVPPPPPRPPLRGRRLGHKLGMDTTILSIRTQAFP